MAYLLFIVIALVSWLVQRRLTNKFETYSRVPLAQPLTGSDVAMMMLTQNGINDVTVRPVAGTLSDYYDPSRHTVNLSQGVCYTNSVAAAAVAAHECGHALQHHYGYAMLKLRTLLVPVVSFASKLLSWVLLAGIMLVEVFPQLLMVAVGLFALTTLFSFVTLPVEVDASRRAVAWLERAGITYGETTAQARDALHAAAYTYVVAALSSMATLFYYAEIAFGRR